MVMMMFMAVFMDMLRAVRGAAKKTADLVGRHIGYYFPAWLQFIAHAFQVVRIHDAEHDFFIHSEGHIYLCALHYRWPVLIANGMAQFQTAANDVLGALILKGGEIQNQHII